MAHDTRMAGMAAQAARVARQRADEACTILQHQGDGMTITVLAADAIAACRVTGTAWLAGAWDDGSLEEAVDVLIEIHASAWDEAQRAYVAGLPERCSRMVAVVLDAHDAARRTLCIGPNADSIQARVQDAMDTMTASARQMDRSCMATYGAAWRHAGRPYQG